MTTDRVPDQGRRADLVADTAPVLLWAADAEGRAWYFNVRWLAARGRSLDEEIRDGWLAAVHPDDRAACDEGWAKAVAAHEPFEAEHRLLCGDGEHLWVMTTVVPAGDGGFVGCAVDVTARRRFEEELRASAAQVQAAFETAVDAVVASTEDGTIVSANRATQRIFGYSVDEMTGRNLSMLMPEPYRSEHDGYLARYRSTGERRIIGIGREIVGRRKDGTTLPLHLSVSEARVGGRRTFTGIMRDISDQKRVEAELAHRAMHDPLTGLPNRALLLDRLGAALARSRRSPSAVAVLFCDLDRFKAVNDTLGHAAGDAVLRQVAVRLTQLVRPADTVARIGGDEFVVVCEDVDASHAVTVAERVLTALRQPFEVLDTEVFLAASVGIVMASEGRGEPDALVRDADQAMYQAKGRGKDRYELFDTRLRRRAVARVQTETALRRALDRRELRLHYQPEMSLVDGRLAGFEALLRWQHPERGLLGPAEFLAVAEDSGLIEPIGDWVIAEACRQGARWAEDGAFDRPIELWVNLSARQLGVPTLVDTVREAVGVLDGAPVRLGLELTESAIMRDADACITTAMALRDIGTRLAIDDFGTGYSSLDYLKRFPVDLLKVDRSFVDGLGDHDAEDAAIVTAVVGLAKALHLDVVAEGVETAAQVHALRDLRCDLAQGYYFARPLPADEAEALIVRR